MSKDFGNDIFNILKELIPLESGYIFFVNPEILKYSYNAETNTIQDIKSPYLKEDLMYKNTVFGQILITGENFSKENREVFKTCACIIANITKDREVSEIIKIQLKALQDGYLKIQRSNQKIIEEEKIKTKFLSNVSHELRTPLNSILGFSDLLSNEFVGSLNTKQKEYINDIKISGIKLLEMINEILDMSKIEANAQSLNISEFDIKNAIQEVINILHPLILKRDINLIINCDNFYIKADYQKFQQILFNLLSNAIKYTKDKIEINAYVSNNNVLISVIDNGIGIYKKNQKKIFKKFEQAGNATGNSTGLGLAITKELVKLHKGEISVSSEHNKGARFTFSIPL